MTTKQERDDLVAGYSTPDRTPKEIWRYCVSLFVREGQSESTAEKNARDAFPDQWNAAEDYFRSGAQLRDDNRRDEELAKRMLPDRTHRRPSIEDRLMALESQVESLSALVATLSGVTRST